MDWMQTITIVGSIVGLWHIFAHTTNAIREDIGVMREDMRERNSKYDAELKESREHWARLLQKSNEIEKKSYALEKEKKDIQKKIYELELEKIRKR